MIMIVADIEGMNEYKLCVRYGVYTIYHIAVRIYIDTRFSGYKFDSIQNHID